MRAGKGEKDGKERGKWRVMRVDIACPAL